MELIIYHLARREGATGEGIVMRERESMAQWGKNYNEGTNFFLFQDLEGPIRLLKDTVYINTTSRSE